MYFRKRITWSTYLPPCAKQTFSLGNCFNTPPIVIQQMAVAVSAGIPETQFIIFKRIILFIFSYFFLTFLIGRNEEWTRCQREWCTCPLFSLSAHQHQGVNTFQLQMLYTQFSIWQFFFTLTREAVNEQCFRFNTSMGHKGIMSSQLD